jgi:hypothetical protein
MSPAAASGPPTAMAGKVISIPRFLKRPASAPSQAVLCQVASSPVATRTGWEVAGASGAQPKYGAVAAVPATRCKKLRREGLVASRGAGFGPNEMRPKGCFTAPSTSIKSAGLALFAPIGLDVARMTLGLDGTSHGLLA